MRFKFTAAVWEWRGPAPFHFVSLPDADAAEVKDLAPALSYGWGAIPASVSVGRTTVTTSIFPKDGGYIVPLKDALRRPEGIAIGDTIRVTVEVDTSRAR
ncbi:MAG: DUF1905 domain-containing protein [Actinomycetales bacterium]|nr:DUF1905 domain-containing protein [Actinomycetales bacterium]